MSHHVGFPYIDQESSHEIWNPDELTMDTDNEQRWNMKNNLKKARWTYAYMWQ